MKALARSGDVKATQSSATNYPSDASPTATGSWSAGSVTETLVDVATSDGKQIVRSASCRFTFSGTNTQSGASFTSPPSTVTLNPTTRVLKVADQDPLVDGDEASDTYGNKVSVTSAATWQTD